MRKPALPLGWPPAHPGRVGELECECTQIDVDGGSYWFLVFKWCHSGLGKIFEFFRQKQLN